MDWPPMFLDPEPQRGYVLNFYVAPEACRQDLARELLALAVIPGDRSPGINVRPALRRRSRGLEDELRRNLQLPCSIENGAVGAGGRAKGGQSSA